MDSGDGGDVDASPSGEVQEQDSLTSTSDLSSSIAERYSLSPQGMYAPGQYAPGMYSSRIGAFVASYQVKPPPKVRERRKPFVLSTYLKSAGAANVYQPTGYQVPKNVAGDGVADNTMISPIQFGMGDPVDAAFSTQKPQVDRKLSDTSRPDDPGRLMEEDDLRRRALHVSKGRKDQYDYGTGS